MVFLQSTREVVSRNNGSTGEICQPYRAVVSKSRLRDGAAHSCRLRSYQKPLYGRPIQLLYLHRSWTSNGETSRDQLGKRQAPRRGALITADCLDWGLDSSHRDTWQRKALRPFPDDEWNSLLTADGGKVQQEHLRLGTSPMFPEVWILCGVKLSCIFNHGAEPL
jgi:hypothetical protein